MTPAQLTRRRASVRRFRTDPARQEAARAFVALDHARLTRDPERRHQLVQRARATWRQARALDRRAA